MGGPEIERLVAILGRLPGYGPRSARRAVLRMLRAPNMVMLPLAAALTEAARAVKQCSRCGNLDSRDPCSICSDAGRDPATLCVVETVGDLWALERALVHRGQYHVLGGVLSPIDGVGPEQLNMRTLLHRAESGAVQEIILALPATVDGATTAYWLAEQLEPFPVQVTRVGHGVPLGGMLEVLDEGTLAAALRGRRPL